MAGERVVGLRRSSLVGVLVTALVGGTAAAAIWPVAVAAMGPWALAWQLTVGLGCTVVGHIVLIGAPRRRSPGHLLILAGLSLFVGPVLVVADQPALGRGLWLATIFVTIPCALLRVVTVPIPRLLGISLCLAGFATAVVGAAGLAHATVLLVMTSAVLFALAMAQQFESTAGEDRRRSLWLILGVTLAVPAVLAPLIAGRTTGGLGVTLAVATAVWSLAAPLAAGVAVLAPRIVDVRAVIERLTVAALMFALAAAGFIGTEAAIVAITGEPPPTGVRALIVVGVAAAFHPVMRWVRASVNEMLFGGRTDPVQTLTMLGSRLADGAAPPEWLDALRVALAAPGVALLDGGQVIAMAGQLGDSPTARTDLRAAAMPVGELVVALATDDPRLARATEAVLDLVSVPLAQALHAARLTEDLRVSRGRAVTALEEERRRVRRDLHDGLGPMLTGLAYSADAVANLLPAHPSEACEIVNTMRDEARDAIAEIRRIVDGLRPRALDELGLVGAVRQQVSRLRAADGRALAVTFDSAPDLPALPAAVEVAAYRVAVEALTNVARHSGVASASASFTLAEGPALRVTVADQGDSASAWTPGVGIASMRERVEQVGGTLWLQAGPGGATVTAEIPLHPAGSPVVA